MFLFRAWLLLKLELFLENLLQMNDSLIRVIGRGGILCSYALLFMWDDHFLSFA